MKISRMYMPFFIEVFFSVLAAAGGMVEFKTQVLGLFRAGCAE